MQFASIDTYLEGGDKFLKPGPVAILFMEDMAETNSTIRHFQQIGFANLAVLGPPALQISPELHDGIIRIGWSPVDGAPVRTIVSQVAELVSGHWLYWGYNAEYLFYPFSETRSIGEFTAFVAEERRNTVQCCVIDLYAPDLATNPDAVSLKEAHFDTAGYYAVARWRDGEPLERQVDVFGGLRWRFEEHVPHGRRRIDRTALFRAEAGLTLTDAFLLTEDEYNTYACPWHHSPTATVCSFRAAKTLKSNPGSSRVIGNFLWPRSEKFSWHSRQLLEHGLMEPGQWF